MQPKQQGNRNSQRNYFLVSLVLLTFLWNGSSVCFAAHERELQQAISMYDRLKFPQALKLLIKLSSKSGLTPKQKAKIYLYQGFCAFYVKNPSVARYKFFIALKINPKLKLPPQTPPPLRRLVALERAKLGIKVPSVGKRLVLSIRPKTPIRGGQSIFFSGNCSKRPLLTQLHLLMRRKGEHRYQAYPLNWKGKKCFGEVSNPFSAPSTKKQQLEYVFQVLKGNRVIKTSPPLNRPHLLTLLPLPVTHSTPKAASHQKGSNVGAILGITLGVAALIGGGTALTLYLLQPKPSGPSVEVRIDIQIR